MITHADKNHRDISGDSRLHRSAEGALPFADHRPQVAAQQAMQTAANNSMRMEKLKSLQDASDRQALARQTSLNISGGSIHPQPVQRKENKTGLSDQLKTGVEALSGISLDDVKVHRNSDQPAKFHAHAYAQGTDIHLAPGQEKHLPHEAWHVVQQKQGRVKPNVQLKGKLIINNEPDLEQEADTMGHRALRFSSRGSKQEPGNAPQYPPANGPRQMMAFAYTPQTEASSDEPGHEQPIQLQYYKTDAGKNPSGLNGYVNVVTGANSIELTGKLIAPGGDGLSPKGAVYMPEYKVADERSKAPSRIREVEGGWWENLRNPSDALRVQNLSAEPKGMKLGQLLTYHHALEAKRRGKPYVIAMKVSDARTPFYVPLGFKDYNGSKPWQQLDNQHRQLEADLRRDADSLSMEEIRGYQERMAALKNEMEDSSMIINTDELITNSKQKFTPVWTVD